jgi:hypothetical protein
MKQIHLISILIIFFVNSTFSQEQASRAGFTLQLAIDDTNYFSADIGPSPYILPENTVQIYPGEKLFIEATIEDDLLTNFTCVDKNSNPDQTIEIEFKQITEGKLHKNMMLSIKNPFKKDIEYKAYIFLVKLKKWVNTSVVNIRAGLSSFEMWPDLISSIALNSWRLK